MSADMVSGVFGKLKKVLRLPHFKIIQINQFNQWEGIQIQLQSIPTDRPNNQQTQILFQTKPKIFKIHKNQIPIGTLLWPN